MSITESDVIKIFEMSMCMVESREWALLADDVVNKGVHKITKKAISDIKITTKDQVARQTIECLEYYAGTIKKAEGIKGEKAKEALLDYGLGIAQTRYESVLSVFKSSGVDIEDLRLYVRIERRKDKAKRFMSGWKNWRNQDGQT